MSTKTAAKKFMTAALKEIESASIREWATSERNYPIILESAGRAADKGTEPMRFATWLVALYIGL